MGFNLARLPARGIRQIGDLYISRGDLLFSLRFRVIAY